MDFFLLGHLRKRVYTFPTRTKEDLVAVFQAGVKTVDANTLRCAAYCGLPSNRWKKLLTPILITRLP
jgi:hypothetical protein